MTNLPESDALVEQVYDTVNQQSGERRRAEVARAALLAAQYRARQLARKEKNERDNRRSPKPR